MSLKRIDQRHSRLSGTIETKHSHPVVVDDPDMVIGRNRIENDVAQSRRDEKARGDREQ